MISDPQFVSLAGLLWAVFTFAPMVLIGMHDYGHFRPDKNKGDKCNQRKIILHNYATQSMCAYRIVMFMFYALAAICITTYWASANPAECAVSPVLYHATIAFYIGYIVLKSMCIVALFHGTDEFTAKLLAFLAFLSITFTVVSVFWTLGQYDGTKPSTFLYCAAVFGVQALAALWYLRFVFKHSSNAEEYRSAHHADTGADKGGDDDFY